MQILNEVARQARIVTYRAKIQQKLASKIIDTGKPEFADLVNDKGVPMSSLNGEILLRKDFRADGTLEGVVSVSPDNLAAMLPDIKVDIDNRTGYNKKLDEWKEEGLEDILKDVVDPTPDEYELTAIEELANLNIEEMSDYDAKQKLKALQAKLALEKGS